MLINSKFQHLPQATHRHLIVVRARGGEFKHCLGGGGGLNQQEYACFQI